MRISKNNLKFVRYGGLSPIIQKGYDCKMPNYHSPPVKKGFYAFVYGYEERFLLGSNIFQSHRMEWIKDSNGNKINHKHPDYDHLSDKFSGYLDRERSDSEVETQDYFFLCKHKKKKIFSYSGDVWHHLSSIPFLHKEAKGSWFLSDYDDYVELLLKEIKDMTEHKNKNGGIGYSFDHLEVFMPS